MNDTATNTTIDTSPPSQLNTTVDTSPPFQLNTTIDTPPPSQLNTIIGAGVGVAAGVGGIIVSGMVYSLRNTPILQTRPSDNLFNKIWLAHAIKQQYNSYNKDHP